MLKWIFGTLTGMLIMISILLTQLMFNINNSPKDKEPVGPPEYHLQVIIQNADEYFWTSFKEGAKVAEEELGVYVEIVPISQRNIENLEEAVEIGRIAGVDGIALQVSDSEQTLNIIEEARKQGIDIITYENDNFIILDIPMVGSNSYNIGVSAGNMAVNATNGRGDAVVVINKGEDKNDISYKNHIV